VGGQGGEGVGCAALLKLKPIIYFNLWCNLLFDFFSCFARLASCLRTVNAGRMKDGHNWFAIAAKNIVSYSSMMYSSIPQKSG
jgi:hypothetical protein